MIIYRRCGRVLQQRAIKVINSIVQHFAAERYQQATNDNEVYSSLLDMEYETNDPLRLCTLYLIPRLNTLRHMFLLLSIMSPTGYYVGISWNYTL